MASVRTGAAARRRRCAENRSTPEGASSVLVGRPAAPRGSARVPWLLGALVAVATLATFLPTVWNDFVDWDDPRMFLDNPGHRGPFLTEIWYAWSSHLLGEFMPVTWMSYALDRLFWGLHAPGYHLTSVLLHALAAVAVYALARRLFGLALGADPPGRHAIDLGAAAVGTDRPRPVRRAPEVSTVGSATDPDELARPFRDLGCAALNEVFRMVRRPRVIRRHMVGHKIQDQPHTPCGQLRPGLRQSFRTADAHIHPVRFDAIRRTDVVLRRKIRQQPTEFVQQTVVCHRNPDTCRTSLPHAHQPDGIASVRGQAVPDMFRDVAEGEGTPCLLAQVVEPDPGINLVDRRVTRPGRHSSETAVIVALATDSSTLLFIASTLFRFSPKAIPLSKVV